MLTQEGQEAARDCLSRSGLGDPAGCFTDSGSHNSLDGRNPANSEVLSASSYHETLSQLMNLSCQMELEYFPKVLMLVTLSFWILNFFTFVFLYILVISLFLLDILM
jgi:hypothetical protein